VNETTRQRVQKGIAELGYIPNQLASGLSRRKTRTFGVIVPDIVNPFWTHVVRGTEEAAWRAGYHVILCNTHANLERERGYANDMLAFQVDGILIGPVGDQSQPILKLFNRNNVPFVLIDRSAAGFPGDIVQGDSFSGAQRVVQHLIDLGHRRIAMINESGSLSTARDRLSGYRKALEDSGINVETSLIVETSTIDTALACRATLELLDLYEPPTAIFAINNIAAIGVTEAAHERGLNVPGDIAVACFDDDYATRFRPFFTSIVQPAETFGTVATQLLLDRLSGHVEERSRNVVLPADLVIRESSGTELLSEL